MLEGYPGPEEVYPAFRDFIGGATLVAHNASFDIAFLAHEMGRLGMSLPNRYVCTLRLGDIVVPVSPVFTVWPAVLVASAGLL